MNNHGNTRHGSKQATDVIRVLQEAPKTDYWGGVEFWAITIAFSLLPIAAEFRAALSISYVQVVLVESMFGGVIISCCVSYFLLRFFNKIPTKNPILKSVILGFVALGIVSILVGVAASRTSDALHVFLIGEVLNIPRFLFLGIVIGYLYKRLYGSGSFV